MIQPKPKPSPAGEWRLCKRCFGTGKPDAEALDEYGEEQDVCPECEGGGWVIPLGSVVLSER